MEKTINRIMEPVVSRGIPFAVTFGNHDEQSGMTNDEQMEIYRNIPGCVDWLNSRGQGNPSWDGGGDFCRRNPEF